MKIRAFSLLLVSTVFLVINGYAQTTGTISRFENVRMCNEFAGADAGAQIAACIADLPSTGGTADATGFEGARSITADPFVGVTKPVRLKLGAATYTLSANSTIPASVEVDFSNGGDISINSGITLTVTGDIVARPNQIFSGSGTVAISWPSQKMDKVYPQWWGCIADGVADCGPSIEAAIKSGGRRIFLPAGQYGIGTPVTISTTNWHLEGESRIYTDIIPLAADIHIGSCPNAMFINAVVPTNAVIEHIRFRSAIAYSGYVFSAISGGACGQQAMFSTVFRENWIAMGSASTGFFDGGLNDSFFTNNDIEITRTVFNLEGPGIGGDSFLDNHITQDVGPFILSTANASTIMQVTGLYVADEKVDWLFNISNGSNWQISKVYLDYEGNSPTTLGGLATLTGMTASTITDFIVSRGTGEMPAFIINGTSGLKLSNGFVNAGGNLASATTCTISIDGANDLDINNVTLSSDLGQQICFGTSTSGNLRISNSRFVDGISYAIEDITRYSINVTLSNNEFLNAAYSGTAVPYIALASSGAVYLRNNTIGKNSASSNATAYFIFSGSGDLFVDDTVFIGGLNLTAGGSTQPVKLGNAHGFSAIFHASAMPTSGSWTQGDTVFNSSTAELGSSGSKYILLGWSRVTTGSGNVLNTDWFELHALTGN